MIMHDWQLAGRPVRSYVRFESVGCLTFLPTSASGTVGNNYGIYVVVNLAKKNGTRS